MLQLSKKLLKFYIEVHTILKINTHNLSWYEVHRMIHILNQIILLEEFFLPL